MKDLFETKRSFLDSLKMLREACVCSSHTWARLAHVMLSPVTFVCVLGGNISSKSCINSVH